MRFDQVHFLHLLWLTIPLVLLLRWAFFRRLRKMKKFVAAELVDQLLINFNRRTIKYKNFMIICVFILSILAMAQPQWGFEWQQVKRQGLDIMVVVDTSKSMLAQDVKPDRLSRTKLAVEDLLQYLKGDRIGLVAFAGSALLMSPLTVDYNAFRLSLDELNVNVVSRGGTNIENAIFEAIKGYENVPNKYKTIILITDGDNVEGDPQKIAQEAKKKGIRIYTIGIGTTEGELIRLPKEMQTDASPFLKDKSGNFVKTRLNETVLQQMSLMTNGIYVKSSGARFGLDFIYERELSKLEKRDIDEKMGKRYYERFQFPLALAVIFLFTEMIFLGRKE